MVFQSFWDPRPSNFEAQIAKKLPQRDQKSSKKLISILTKFLIDFGMDFRTAQEGPKIAQDSDPSAKTAPRGPQDSPKSHQESARKPSFFDLGRQELPKPSQDRSKSDLWLIFG